MKNIIIAILVLPLLSTAQTNVKLTWVAVTGIDLTNNGYDIQRSGSTGIWRLSTTASEQFSAGDTLYFSCDATTAYNAFGLFKTAPPTAGTQDDYQAHPNVLYGIYTGNTSGTAYMGVTEAGTHSTEANPGDYKNIRFIYDLAGNIRYERATTTAPTTWVLYKTSSGATGSYYPFAQLAGDVTYSAWRNVYLRKYISGGGGSGSGSSGRVTVKWH